MKHIDNLTGKVAALNQKYHALERINRRHGDLDNLSDRELTCHLAESQRAADEFDRALADLKATGAVVKFDKICGEYFTGEQIHHVAMTVISRGVVAIDAGSAECALEVARELAAVDEIDLVEDSVEFEVSSILV